MFTHLELGRRNLSSPALWPNLRLPRTLVLMLAILIFAPTTVGQDKPIELKTIGVEGDLALYNYIKVKVENLQEWVKKPDNDFRKFILYIDGTAFPGLEPQLVECQRRRWLVRLKPNEKGPNNSRRVECH